MDAWEILRANSTAPTGADVWTLINTQAGGAGDIHIGPILAADIDLILTAEIGDVLSADLLMTTLSANMSDDAGANTIIDLEVDV